MAMENIDAARRLLVEPADRPAPLGMLTAAAFAALAAVLMAGVTVLGPGVTIVEGSMVMIR